MQEHRVSRIVEERERAEARRRAARHEPVGLNDLLNALAQGLAGIGLRGSGVINRPARPAY